jgi:alcohol dehydrogenase
VIHGRAVGLTLPAVLAYNQQDPAISAIYADLARTAGLADARASDQKATHLILEKVLHLRNLAKLPTSLAEVGSEHSDLEQLAKDAAEQWTGTFNPRRVGEAELYQIYQSIDEFAEGSFLG